MKSVWNNKRSNIAIGVLEIKMFQNITKRGYEKGEWITVCLSLYIHMYAYVLCAFQAL